METKDIAIQYRGWWRITETTTWMKEDLDAIGTALISFTGYDDRLRMLYLLANIRCKPTKTGVSFTWKGAWEFDQLTGSGRVTLGKDGRLNGVFKIKNGDDSTFIAERAEAPDEPIPDPPSYQDKWRRRW
jgi:hypothetical protein